MFVYDGGLLQVGYCRCLFPLLTRKTPSYCYLSYAKYLVDYRSNDM